MRPGRMTMHRMAFHRIHLLPSLVVGAVLAFAGSGCEDSPAAGPELGSEGVPAFRESASERGVDFILDSGDDGGPKLFPEIMPGGVAVFDADGDRDLDLYFVQMGPIEPERAGDRRNRLYLNRGDGHFTDATDGSGAADPGNGSGAAIGDYDGDGTVGGADLSQLLGAWNSANAELDLSGDGFIDGADLTIILASWGGCS